ncbi:hypothetical protein [Micromonospora globbae]|uniref:hypothetical protein n=1 Tax=Micromonospora globbae TaxID=1894969 RepID=UPI00342D5A48
MDLVPIVDDDLGDEGVDQLLDLCLVATLDGFGDVCAEDLQVGGRGDLRGGEQRVLEFVAPNAQLTGLAAEGVDALPALLVGELAVLEGGQVPVDLGVN